MDPVHHLVEPVLALDQLAGAAAEPGQPLQEPLVDRRVHPDRVDPHPAQPRGEQAQELVLVADLPVGHQDQHRVAPARPG
jgi:hypothetical protein